MHRCIYILCHGLYGLSFAGSCDCNLNKRGSSTMALEGSFDGHCLTDRNVWTTDVAVLEAMLYITTVSDI